MSCRHVATYCCECLLKLDCRVARTFARVYFCSLRCSRRTHSSKTFVFRLRISAQKLVLISCRVARTYVSFSDRRFSYRSSQCQTRVTNSLIGNLARHSFSLFEWNKTQPQTSKTSEQRLAYQWPLITSRTMDDYRNSPTIKFCADLFPAYSCPSAIKFKIRLECVSVN